MKSGSEWTAAELIARLSREPGYRDLPVRVQVGQARGWITELRIVRKLGKVESLVLLATATEE